jgi:putative oxidoreductase
MAEGLFVIRAVLGLLLFAHGAQKLFGWWGGHGLDGTGGFFHQVGHRPGRQMAAVAGASEAAGGVLMFLGLLTPLAAAAIIGVMTVAAVSVHKDNGLWATNGGYELPMFYGVVAAGLAFTGPGSFSIDNGLGLHLAGWAWGLGAVVLGLAGAAVQLSRRSRALATPSGDAYPADTARADTANADLPGDPASADEATLEETMQDSANA